MKSEVAKMVKKDKRYDKKKLIGKDASFKKEYMKEHKDDALSYNKHF